MRGGRETPRAPPQTRPRSSGCSSLASSSSTRCFAALAASPPTVTTMTPGSCSVMNCPLTYASVLLAIQRARHDAGIVAEQDNRRRSPSRSRPSRRRSAARPMPSRGRRPNPSTCLSPRAGESVESIGASVPEVPPPSVTASMLDASTLPASASTALLAAERAFCKGVDVGRRNLCDLRRAWSGCGG